MNQYLLGEITTREAGKQMGISHQGICNLSGQLAIQWYKNKKIELWAAPQRIYRKDMEKKPSEIIQGILTKRGVVNAGMIQAILDYLDASSAGTPAPKPLQDN